MSLAGVSHHAVHMTGQAPGSHRLWRRGVLPLVVIVAMALRLWHLGDAGYGTEYYAAAVRSMLTSWHNLLYNAFDPAGVLSVDKPPLALWVQVASARLLGYGPFAVNLPQAIEGGLAIVVLWYVVRRDFGETAAGLAALFLALTPVSIAVDRSNNTDSLLVLTLLLAAWAMPQREETSAGWRLMLAFALVGVGFNVKMLAAFGVLPGFAACALLGTDAPWSRRLQRLAAAGAVLALVSASWIAVVALTPPGERPAIDSSASNSILDLVFNHNAAQRFVPRAGRAPGPVEDATSPAPVQARHPWPPAAPAGPGRLADPALASQALWLLPLALAGAAATVMQRRRASACIWIGWAGAYGLVFSFAGGLFSPYYLVLLAPPLAALAGIGVVAVWSVWQAAPQLRRWLPLALLLGLAWQAHILWPTDWSGPRAAILVAASGGMLLAVGALGWAAAPGRSAARRGAPALAGVMSGVAALLVAPGAGALTTIAYEGGRPMARLEPSRNRNDPATASDSRAMLALLPLLQERRGAARFLAATGDARLAAPLIIATGAPVIALGGYQGSVPVLDGAAIERLSATGALRLVVIAHRRRTRANLGEAAAVQWVRAHASRVDLADADPAVQASRLELYDLQQAPPAGVDE